MKKMLIVVGIAIAVIVAVNIYFAQRKSAARAAAESLLDAMKTKDAERVMEYLDYDDIVWFLNIFASIGGGSFTPETMKKQLRESLEEQEKENGPFDYEIADVQVKHGSYVKVTAQTMWGDGEKEEMFLIMTKEGGRWKCDLWASGEEEAREERKRESEEELSDFDRKRQESLEEAIARFKEGAVFPKKVNKIFFWPQQSLSLRDGTGEEDVYIGAELTEEEFADFINQLGAEKAPDLLEFWPDVFEGISEGFAPKAWDPPLEKKKSFYYGENPDFQIDMGMSYYNGVLLLRSHAKVRIVVDEKGTVTGTAVLPHKE